MAPEPTTTQLLLNARGGDRDALDALLPRVYDELRRLAHVRLRRYRRGETLNTTAIVHEAYLNLTAGETPSFNDRTHFFALAARAMRFVLIGYARAGATQKRGGPGADLPLDEALAVAAADRAEAQALDLLALDAALDRLATVSERLAEVVELRFFGGMQHDEIAVATGRSVPTVKRDWQRARAYLYRLMREDEAGGAAGDAPGGETASTG
ncbi:MAG: ECF-type sigma factor [Rubricoccaceae bacterium]|nr:ECF-type sigma factor [Rubricoccaceae bacterium]